MADTMTAPAELHRRRVARERRRRHVREAQPGATGRGRRRVPELRRARTSTSPSQAADDARRGWAGAPDRQARRRADRGRRADRRARRGDRAGHDARDGQAAARGAHGGGARGADPALLGRRGVPPGRRALRAGGHRRAGLHRAPSGRRRRADHAVELPRRDPGLEARARADLRQHDRAQARAGLAAHRACTSPARSTTRASPAACSTSSSGAARTSARRSSSTRACARSPSPARSPSARASASRPGAWASARSSSSAATTR